MRYRYLTLVDCEALITPNCPANQRNSIVSSACSKFWDPEEAREAVRRARARPGNPLLGGRD